MTILRAKERDLSIWSQGGDRGRYDYTTDEYLLSEMLNHTFFGHCWALLRKGDYITITDAEDQIMVVRVDEILKEEWRVLLSKIERIYASPVVELKGKMENDPGLIHRWRSTRGGGHSILTSRGEVFAINFESRIEAEQAIAKCYETQVFEPPFGHEPTPDFVSQNTKTWSGNQ